MPDPGFRGEATAPTGSKRAPITRTHVLICHCGYSTPVTSPRIADNALRRHHCHLDVPPLWDTLPDAIRLPVQRYVRAVRRRHYDIDSIAVERFATGETVPLNHHERFAAYALMRAHGVPKNTCATRLRLSWSRQAFFRGLVETPA